MEEIGHPGQHLYLGNAPGLQQFPHGYEVQQYPSE